jgi:hypothetical protein
VTYAIEQRLRLIDFLLAQYGYVNRSALIDYFGVSMPQASHDVREYLKLAPRNATYCLTQKAYLRSDDFKRVYA